MTSALYLFFGLEGFIGRMFIKDCVFASIDVNCNKNHEQIVSGFFSSLLNLVYKK